MATKAHELNKDEAVEMVRAAAKNIVAGKAKGMGLVRCTNFRCFGIMGDDGVWRDADNRRLDVLEIETEF